MEKHIQKHSIRAQMFKTIFTVAASSTLILGLAVFSGLLQIRSQTLEINYTLGQQAANDSREILENESGKLLTVLAKSKAVKMDFTIYNIMSQVDILASSAQALYNEPESFSRIGILPPDNANQGKFETQILYAEQTSPESVADEVGLIGNLNAQMNGIGEHTWGIGAAQISTESGFTVISDDKSDLRTDIDYFDPTVEDWYKMAADSNEAVWSDVYDDPFGQGFSINCGKAVRDSNGRLKAVVSLFSTLDKMGTTITDMNVGETGCTFVVTRDGYVIISNTSEYDIGTKIYLSNVNDSIRTVGQKIANGERGLEQVKFRGEDFFIAYEPIESMPWTVITMVEVKEVLEPAIQDEIEISMLSVKAEKEILSTIRFVGIFFIIASIVSMTVAAALSRVVSAWITEPISLLTKKVSEISGGNLDEKIEIHTGNEIETLAEAFNSTTASLKQYISDLTAVTSEKERISAELNVATDIQASMLPSIFPAFPEREEFDIYATMDPAKEVGGDFYDFFMVDEQHLAVVVADVSGKGVPAALFMVIGKTLIKDHTRPGCDLTGIFYDVNNLLCESNSEGLFITAFEGVLDLVTGEFVYVNAGHEMPYICRKDGVFELHEIGSGFVLAGMENMEFFGGRLVLNAGDKVFQYTDGVTEAINIKDELYGDDRLGAFLRENSSLSPRELLRAVKADIDNFAGETEQFDDITMLCLEYRKAMRPEKDDISDELTIEATVENIILVTDFVNKQLDMLNCPVEAKLEIDVAIDELFGNIASYAYDPETGPATVRIETEKEPLSVIVTFIDNGVPYDPLKKADPDISLSAEEREIGGLGIFMVKQSMDSVEYEYKNGQNILKIKKSIE